MTPLEILEVHDSALPSTPCIFFHSSFQDCNRDFGISKESQHSIDDSSMSASSHELGFPPQNGRLFSQKAWMPAAHDRSQFLMIDLNEMMIIVKSATQGSGSVGVAGARVISYLLHYSIDGDTWSVILEKELPKVKASLGLFEIHFHLLFFYPVLKLG